MDKIKFNLYLFNIIIIIIYLAYITIFFGIVVIDEKYIRKFSILFQLVICIFLIWRFSPFKQVHVLTKIDTAIIFYCATFLLMNVVAIEVYVSFLQGKIIGNQVNTIKNTVDTTAKHILPIVKN